THPPLLPPWRRSPRRERTAAAAARPRAPDRGDARGRVREDDRASPPILRRVAGWGQPLTHRRRRHAAASETVHAPECALAFPPCRRSCRAPNRDSPRAAPARGSTGRPSATARPPPLGATGSA